MINQVFGEFSRSLSTHDTQLRGHFDGREIVPIMRDSGSPNWRQMEWCGFYIEEQSFTWLGDTITRGDKIHNTEFDLKIKSSGVLGDVKAHSVGAGAVILNDCAAMDAALEKHGKLFVVRFDIVPTMDNDGSFMEFHQVLKGGTSSYSKRARARGARRRVRKSGFRIEKIVGIELDAESWGFLKKHPQGRNSNGSPRPRKYMMTPGVLQETVLWE